MLHLIESLTDKFFELIYQDPVRPNVPHVDRIGANKDIFVFRDEDDKVKAITCVSYQSSIPTKESELFETTDSPSIAVFYTIWSYAAGAGRELIVRAQESIKQEFPDIDTYVTLSPKTEMARRFHLKNGAGIYRENSDTVNYIYK